MACYACNTVYAPRAMRHVPNDQEEKIQIIIRYRENVNINPAPFTNDSRICINCDRLANIEIQQIRDDPESLYLNVLKQSESTSCVICNSQANHP